MNHDAQNDHPIHELLRRRWSPTVFDPERDVGETDLRSLFEAVRWTMSSYNEQPWRYIVGVRSRSPEVWEQVLDVLVEGNRAWARRAPVLALGLTEHRFERNGKENKAARHDLGAASASLTFEATARGLHVHQMIGIEPDRARETFDIGDSLEPLTGLAIGHAGDPDDAEEKHAERDRAERERRPLDELILHGGF
ncbi:MAG: nitroreductase family protein [Gammaproteobacteria bacterium]|nr:nitroreductase family protein [Gammaproteobacteria bacterium]